MRVRTRVFKKKNGRKKKKTAYTGRNVINYFQERKKNIKYSRRYWIMKYVYIFTFTQRTYIRTRFLLIHNNIR